jgi:hypothetical protein
MAKRQVQAIAGIVVRSVPWRTVVEEGRQRAASRSPVRTKTAAAATEY